MKKFSLIIFTVFSLQQSFFAQEGWFWQNPLPQGDDLRSVCFATPTIGWCVGSFGTILHTTDGGESWTSQTSGTTEWLSGVSFTDTDNCVAVGESGTILKTTDAGTTWTSQTSGTTEWLSGVSFTDLDNGIVVGWNGIILKTTDGGTTWISQTSGTTNHLSAVDFIDSNNGTVVGNEGTILKTTNGGINWASQSSGTYHWLFGVAFSDSNYGTAVGYAGTILRTTDGGTNWTSQISGTPYYLQSVSFTDSISGTAVGYAGFILRTTDGGATWTNEQRSAELDKFVRDPELAYLGGKYYLMGRSSGRPGPYGRQFALYQSEDGIHWGNGVLVNTNTLHPDGYSSTCIINRYHPTGPEELMVVYSIAYNEEKDTNEYVFFLRPN